MFPNAQIGGGNVRRSGEFQMNSIQPPVPSGPGMVNQGRITPNSPFHFMTGGSQQSNAPQMPGAFGQGFPGNQYFGAQQMPMFNQNPMGRSSFPSPFGFYESMRGRFAAQPVDQPVPFNSPRPSDMMVQNQFGGGSIGQGPGSPMMQRY